MQYILFPGWPGPINPRGPGVGGVAYPAYPALPARPTGPVHPGAQFAGGAPPTGGGPVNTPLSGLQAHGVPVGYTPGGQPMVMAGMANQGVGLPPTITGMPQMPGLPAGMLGGAMGEGGLFQPIAPVAAFDPTNQVQQLQAQQYQAQMGEAYGK